MGIQESLGLDSTYLSGSEINAANGVSVVRKSDESSSWDKKQRGLTPASAHASS
jgi:hypothetical protein